LEQLRVNVNGDGSNTNSQNYWNTGLFVEQVTALATPLLVRLQCAKRTKTIFTAVLLCLLFVFILILPMPSKEGETNREKKRTNDIYSEPYFLPFSLKLKKQLAPPNYQIRTVEFFISSSDIDIKQVQIFSKLVY
jgi:hypothetical protein